MHNDAPDPLDAQTLKWGAILGPLLMAAMPALCALAMTIASYFFPHWTW